MFPTTIPLCTIIILALYISSVDAQNSSYPLGTVHGLEGSDLNVYDVAGDENTTTTNKVAVIVLYDIRGFNVTNTRLFCERLAYEYKIRVLMPDFFRNQPTAAATWPRVEQDLLTVNTYLSQNYSKLAVIGFCWGGLRVMKACGNGNNNSWTMTPYFTGISIHGSGLNVQDAEVLQAPMLFIRAGNDPPLDNITAVLDQKPFGSECEYKVYENMRHGFVSAGANYSDPANVAAIDDVHLRVRTYLSKILTDDGNSTTYPLGTVHGLEGSDLNVYDVAGDENRETINKVAVIVLYDIRGFNVTNTRLFCERLAYEYKIRVLMPDFFR
ncbi:unnamed protein product, partial [Didymodactylos carnosus]